MPSGGGNARATRMLVNKIAAGRTKQDDSDEDTEMVNRFVSSIP